LAKEFKPVERGWRLGSEEFRRELLAKAKGRLGESRFGAERREAQEAKARRLLREEMDRLGWDQAALLRAGKGDKGKARIAARLRKETAMSLKWIAQNVAMGSWTHVSNLLGAKRKRDTLESEQ